MAYMFVHCSHVTHTDRLVGNPIGVSGDTSSLVQHFKNINEVIFYVKSVGNAFVGIRQCCVCLRVIPLDHSNIFIEPF